MVQTNLFALFAGIFLTGTIAVAADPSPGVPLFFDVQGKSLKISPPHVFYDLQTSKGESANLGNGIVLTADSLKATLDGNQLQVSWDRSLLEAGELSVITEQGQELWKHDISGEGLWVLQNVQGPEAPGWTSGEKFHFCLRFKAEKGHVNLCSPIYGIKISEAGGVLGRSRSEVRPRVIFQNEEKPLKGDFEVKPGEPVQFLATLKSGTSYDFMSEPLTAPVIKDMVQAPAAGQVVLMGAGPRPLNQVSEVIPGEVYGSLTRRLGFEKTIAEKQDLWKVAVPERGALLSLPGKSGGVFFYTLEIENPPKESDRLFVAAPLLAGTYSSQDQQAVVDVQGKSMVWNYAAPERWTEGKVVYEKSYFDVYRGSAGEVSARLTGVATSERSLIAMGEVHASWWFNDIFGWQNPWLSKQRWGVSAKYFNSLMDFPVSVNQGQSEKVYLSVQQADVRYRLSPGLWERDESVGLIGAFENVTLGSDQVSKMGAGAFWARSMPRAIDRWFSKLPYMNYPKWVDMEFISYLASPDRDVKLQADFVLNFHGKVLWTPRFFGEAGLGLKNYHYEFQSSGDSGKLTTFYGTLGVGLNF